MDPPADQEREYYDDLTTDDEALDQTVDIFDQTEAIADEDEHDGAFYKQFTNIFI